ncbi:cobalt ECF transporter T component CbiQ [Tessaracoccus sp. MC1679]|uniref:cobalt ECF transporter T component CbiQ n=1 Tax=Tessaracoccus sp. MC1679 TaxID=2760313 RepID=UPI00160492D4|nr:cobalt ECF transporter T component CbiQ [Tessaracoccus sp. MC1679]
MSIHVTAVDDAAWAGPWRAIPVGHKVGLAVALVLTALLTPAWPGTLLVAGASLILMLGPARIRPGLVAAVAMPPLAFLVVGALPLAVEVGDGLRITADGGLRAAEMLAHGVAGTLAVLLLATTTPMSDVLGWLHRRGLPGPLLEIAALMYRLLFVLLSSALALQAAQAARLGGDAPFSRRFQAAVDGIGTVLLMSWRRATRLQAGLELRGYEDALPTLRPVGRTRPWAPAAGAALVAGIWLACWAVA